MTLTVQNPTAVRGWLGETTVTYHQAVICIPGHPTVQYRCPHRHLTAATAAHCLTGASVYVRTNGHIPPDWRPTTGDHP